MVDLLTDLNEQQRSAVTHTGSPLLIVAGAGTGKTTVITRRIAWLLSQGYRADELLALTFTDKAAQEMEDRVGSLLPFGFGDLWVSTFHAFGERVLRRHAADIGLHPDFRVLSPTECWFLLRRCLDRFPLDYYRPRGNPTKFFPSLLRHFSRAKDEGIGVGAYRQYAEHLRLNRDALVAEGEAARVWEVAESYRVYQELLSEENALDFGDLLLCLSELFEARPHILAQYQRQFLEILVDEFQDTNAIQYRLVKMLGTPKESVTVVADDDQAIYRWRGASFNNTVQFARDFPNSRAVVLRTNYRSAQNILDCAYRFIQQNNPHRLEAAVANGKAGSLGAVVKELQAAEAKRGELEHLHATTEEAEARLVAERIAKLRSQGASWSDFAILVRSNSDAAPFSRSLSEADIPFQYPTARGLFRRPLVLDCASYLRVVDNVLNSTALWRLLNSPVFTFSVLDLATLTERTRERGDVSLFALAQSACRDASFDAAGRAELERLLHLVETGAREARDKPVGTVLLGFLEQSGCLKKLTADAEKHRGVLADLGKFFSIIDRFSRVTDDPSVRAFVEYLDLSLAAGDEGTNELDMLTGPDAVNILTVHSAKGLEFPYVFLVHLVDRRFPTTERADALELPDMLRGDEDADGVDHHLLEERRLFYVGMTRAREGLFFTSAEDYGLARKKRLSRFLFEAGLATPEAPPKPTGRTRFESEGMRNIESGIMGSGVALSDKKLLITNYQLPVPDTFSYTQLRAYETCPLQYKFAHMFALPRRGNPSLSFGKTLHATLERFFQLARDGAQEPLFGASDADGRFKIQDSGVRMPSLPTLLELYERSWIAQWYHSAEQADEYRARGRHMLEAFYARHVQLGWPQIWALEKPFLMNLGGILLKGKIDRLDRIAANTDGVVDVEVVDYKTGKPPKEERAVDRDQLLLYQLAVSTVLGARVEKLSYHFLENGSVVSFLGTPEELAALELKISQTVSAIRSSAFSATPSPTTCRFCDFKEICEYRQV